jgi:MFS family permease
MTAALDADGAARRARTSIGSLFFLIGALNATWVGRIPALRDHLHLADRELGLLLLTPAAGAMIAFRFAGRLTAHHGSRRVARVATALLCVLVILPAYAPSPLWAALGLGALGATSGMMDVSINAHAVEVERRLGRPILGSLHGLACLGRLAGASGGALAAWQGQPPTVHFVIAAVVGEAVAVVLGRGLLPHGTASLSLSPAGAAVPVGEPTRRATRHVGVLVALGALCFCSSASEGAMADWSGVYLRDTLHASEAIAASAYAVFSLAMLVGRFASDGLTTRLGSTGLVRYGGLLITVAMAIGLAINTTPAMIAAFVCIGLGVATLVPAAFRAGARIPGVAPGAAIATLATVSYGAFFVGPPLLGQISYLVTLRGALLVVAALGLVLAVLAPVVEGRPLVIARS